MPYYDRHGEPLDPSDAEPDANVQCSWPLCSGWEFDPEQYVELSAEQLMKLVQVMHRWLLAERALGSSAAFLRRPTVASQEVRDKARADHRQAMGDAHRLQDEVEEQLRAWGLADMAVAKPKWDEGYVPATRWEPADCLRPECPTCGAPGEAI